MVWDLVSQVGGVWSRPVTMETGNIGSFGHEFKSAGPSSTIFISGNYEKYQLAEQVRGASNL